MGSETSPSRLNDFYSDRDQGDRSVELIEESKSPDKSDQFQIDLHTDFNKLVLIR